MIAETKAKSSSLDSPTSPARLNSQKITLLSPEKTISPINNNVQPFSFNKSLPNEANIDQLHKKVMSMSPKAKSPINNLLDRISPRTETKLEKTKYIQSELDALEREQESIDEKANELEKKLRAVMGGDAGIDDETEDQLMAQWFTLGECHCQLSKFIYEMEKFQLFFFFSVNKKNALLRRQMQLNILEQESDLERKYELLNLELRAAMSVEDWRKTEEQREREKLLLAELLTIVDKRNELVLNLHSQEQA